MNLSTINHLTNELVAARADKSNIPKERKGVKLHERQQKELALNDLYKGIYQLS